MSEQHNATAYPSKSLLCRSYTCPCQCSATPLVCYSMPKHSIPLLCPNMATLRLALASHCSARTLHRYSMPLLRYARLDLSVQCLSDTILIIATTKRYLSTPLLSLSSQCLRSSCPCHRRSLPFSALAPLIPASPLLVITFHRRNAALLSRSSSNQLRYES